MSAKIHIIDLQQYERLERISKNTYYDLYKVREISTDKIFMAKVANSLVEDESTNYLLQEINNGFQYNIQSIIKYIGYSPVNFENKKRPVIIIEYCSNGLLDNVIDLESNSKPISGWNDTKKLITLYGIAYAMSLIHSQNIIFKDLGAHNVFMNDSLFPKIHGFSHASLLSDNQELNQESNSDIVPTYMAPEIMSDEPFQLKSDVYSFGILAYEIVSGKKAFSKASTLMKVLIGYRPEFSESVPQPYQELISRCWSGEIEERPLFSEIVEMLKTDSSFITANVDQKEFNNYIELLESMPEDEQLLQQGLELLQVNKVEAFNCFKKSADKDNTEAMNYCAILLLNDEDIPYNEEEAKNYLKKSADLGNIKAMNNYGFLLLQSDCTRPTEDKASYYLQKAADKGCIEAMINYGNLLYCGDEKQNIPADKKEALRYFKMAAEKNSTDGMYYYGLMLKNGEGVDKPDFKQALNLFKQASDCEDGKAEAMLEYGLLLIKDDASEEIPHNFKEALEYFKKASDKGNIDATYYCGFLLFNGADGVPINKEEGIEFYRKAAKKGQPNGMDEYAILLENGDADENNTDKLIIKYYKLSADFGCVDAMYNYGWLLFNGIGVNTDMEKALRYFKKAADFGNVDAMYKYATMMKYGEGSTPDKNEALKYYKKAADEGSSDAMNSYALMLYKDNEITPNDEEALKYFKMAADLGHANAMNNYGEMLLNGKGTPQDSNKAIEYFKMAADQEDPEGIVNYQKTA